MGFGKNRKDPDENSETFKEKIASQMGIDREIMLNFVHIEVTGNRELFIENHKGIIEYTDRIIRIKASPSALKIEGKCLEIKTMTREMLCVTGYFKLISFSE